MADHRDVFAAVLASRIVLLGRRIAAAQARTELHERLADGGEEPHHGAAFDAAACGTVGRALKDGDARFDPGRPLSSEPVEDKGFLLAVARWRRAKRYQGAGL